MFQPNPEDHLHLRLHRARSVVLTSDELPNHVRPARARRLVEIRAAQRTFEGAYMRTALGQFSFALIILKIFTFRTSGNSVALLAGLSLAAYSTLLVLTWQLVS
ncbi:hypothetical protein VdG1_06919 [Verticillium dahliae VDG1]|nr:hypothetical protein VdG1_06919 [Verticillium dahliae VDG1]